MSAAAADCERATRAQPADMSQSSGPLWRPRQLGFIPSVCMSSVALSLTACPLVTAPA